MVKVTEPAIRRVIQPMIHGVPDWQLKDSAPKIIGANFYPEMRDARSDTRPRRRRLASFPHLKSGRSSSRSATRDVRLDEPRARTDGSSIRKCARTCTTERLTLILSI